MCLCIDLIVFVLEKLFEIFKVKEEGISSWQKTVRFILVVITFIFLSVGSLVGLIYGYIKLMQGI